MKGMVLFFVVFTVPALAQLSREVDTPIDKLPEGVSAPAGKVTLIADYAVARPRSPIPVYLVNLSDHDIQLDAQDGDVYLKLETVAKSGEWVRAQPHAFSFCGNSYDFRPNIRKGHFYRIEGYQPRSGEKARVRYRLYCQKGLEITSQEGSGLCSDSDIAKAASDALAVSSGSFEFVASVAKGEKQLTNAMDHIQHLQSIAIEVLGSGRFPADKVTPVLDYIATKFPKLRNGAQNARNRLENVSPYEGGRRSAQSDIARGVLALVAFGAPNANYREYEKLLRDRYGVTVRWIADNDVQVQVLEHWKGYNAVAKAEIERRFSTNVFQEAQAEVLALDERRNKSR